jgi:hypothetical protein
VTAARHKPHGRQRRSAADFDRNRIPPLTDRTHVMRLHGANCHKGRLRRCMVRSLNGGPPPRRTTAGPSAGGRPTPGTAAPATAFGEAPTPSVAPLVLGAVISAVAVATLFNGWFGDAGTTTTISRMTVTGWVLGAVIAPAVFAWFRTGDMKARSDIRFVEPSWRPSRVAALVAVAGWFASVGHAWLIASSVARS